MATLCSRSTLCGHSFSPVLRESIQRSTKSSSDNTRQVLMVRASSSAGTSCRGEASTAALDHGIDILRVSANASKREVKDAYRRLALRFHPDVCKGDECEVNFSEVNMAYESLMTHLSSSSDNRHHTQPGHGFRGESGFRAAEESASASQADNRDHSWADFLQNLVHKEQLREDYSSYYSNLKYYSKAGRRSKRFCAGSYQYW